MSRGGGAAAARAPPPSTCAGSRGDWPWERFHIWSQAGPVGTQPCGFLACHLWPAEPQSSPVKWSVLAPAFWSCRDTAQLTKGLRQLGGWGSLWGAGGTCAGRSWLRGAGPVWFPWLLDTAPPRVGLPVVECRARPGCSRPEILNVAKLLVPNVTLTGSGPTRFWTSAFRVWGRPRSLPIQGARGESLGEGTEGTR